SFFFQAEDGIRDFHVTGVQTCALPICGSQGDGKEPKTAKEKQLQEAKTKGEVDAPNSKWGGWRYQGDRDDCFYVVGRKCFRSKKIGRASCRERVWIWELAGSLRTRGRR